MLRKSKKPPSAAAFIDAMDEIRVHWFLDAEGDRLGLGYWIEIDHEAIRYQFNKIEAAFCHTPRRDRALTQKLLDLGRTRSFVTDYFRSGTKHLGSFGSEVRAC